MMARVDDGLSPDPRKWREGGGDHRIFGGTTPITDCDPHFHETYIIAFIRRGRARTLVNREVQMLRQGDALLLNPYDVVECSSDEDFAYDVCYPDRAFVCSAYRTATGRSGVPRFAKPLLTGRPAGDVGALLERFRGGDGRPQVLQSDLSRLLAGTVERAAPDGASARPESQVDLARELIERLIEEPISVKEISDLVSRSRSHFSRVFRAAVGLPPNAYIRQLRLARAVDRVRAGEPLADIATLYGFFDQAHFTREFKRVYGTTPGRMARDIRACRHCT